MCNRTRTGAAGIEVGLGVAVREGAVIRLGRPVCLGRHGEADSEHGDGKFARDWRTYSIYLRRVVCNVAILREC